MYRNIRFKTKSLSFEEHRITSGDFQETIFVVFTN